MSKVIIEEKGNVAILRLNNGVTNAIGTELIKDFSSKLKIVRQDFKGILLAGNTKFFCIGFDLPELIKLDRKGMADFNHKFNQLTLDLFTLPIPTACAIAGHATAGGNILAVSCDYRFAASVDKIIGLNEIRLGVPVPYLPDLILRQIVGDRIATEMLYNGKFYSLSDAKETGLVDGVFPLDDLEDQAVSKISELAGLPQPAFAALKSNRVESVRQRYEKNFRLKDEEFLDCWFSPGTETLLLKASKKF